MATPAPAVPSNFAVQQGNGQVFVSCAVSIGATSYPVLRSTDNATFTVIASPATPSYLDTSVVVGTQYFYQMQAANSSATSLATNSLSIVPALTGTMSLQQIRTMSKQRADMMQSSFVTDPEWNNFINQSLFELYDLLVTTYEDYYVAAPYTFTTDGTNYQYALPPNTDKILGVDVGLSSANNGWVTIQKFNFQDRNNFVYPAVTNTFAGVFNARYRIVGTKLHLIPTPSAGQTLRVWYVPRMTQLLQDSDIADGVNGWLQYVIVRAAKYAMDKEESDSSKLDTELAFMKQRIEETATNRDAGAPDTITNVRKHGSSNGEGNWGGY